MTACTLLRSDAGTSPLGESDPTSQPLLTLISRGDQALGLPSHSLKETVAQRVRSRFEPEPRGACLPVSHLVRWLMPVSQGVGGGFRISLC